MKIKSGFLLREIAGTKVIIPIGERVIEFKGMLMPNETGSFIWDKLIIGVSYDDLLLMILEEYDVDKNTAKIDLDEFLTDVRRIGAIEE